MFNTIRAVMWRTIVAAIIVGTIAALLGVFDRTVWRHVSASKPLILNESPE